MKKILISSPLINGKLGVNYYKTKILIIKRLKVLKHQNRNFCELLHLNSELILSQFQNKFHLNNYSRKNRNTQNKNTLSQNTLQGNIKILHWFGQKISQLTSNKISGVKMSIGMMTRKKD